MEKMFGLLQVDQSTVAMVEHFGRFVKALDPGCHCVPWCCCYRPAGLMSLRVRQLDVRCETKTKDNVFVTVVASIQYQAIREQIEDAFYKLQDPQAQIRSYVFDVVRASVPKMDPDRVFEMKSEIFHSSPLLQFPLSPFLSALSLLFPAVVRASVPKMDLDRVFEVKNEIAHTVEEELEKVGVWGGAEEEVRASVPKMDLDRVFEVKNEIAHTVEEELEKVRGRWGWGEGGKGGTQRRGEGSGGACKRTAEYRVFEVKERDCSYRGEELDKNEIAHAVDSSGVEEELEKAMRTYGYRIVQTLIVDVEPDHRVKAAMNEINAAQRIRMATQEKAEAEKILQVKKAEGEAEAKYLAGVGVARQRQAIVDGLRDSVLGFSDQVPGTTPKDVLDMAGTTPKDVLVMVRGWAGGEWERVCWAVQARGNDASTTSKEDVLDMVRGWAEGGRSGSAGRVSEMGARAVQVMLSQSVDTMRDIGHVGAVMLTQYFDTMRDIGANNRSSTIFVPHGPGAAADIAAQIRDGMMQSITAARTNM
ncbi:unnamed protein product [Closterium sp. NIES-65]|nr:unnamed protein product [Closterium sp. NIES-65]